MVLLGHKRVPQVLLRLVRSLVLGATSESGNLLLLIHHHQAGRDNRLLDGGGGLVLAEPLRRHEAFRGRRLRA